MSAVRGVCASGALSAVVNPAFGLARTLRPTRPPGRAHLRPPSGPGADNAIEEHFKLQWVFGKNYRRFILEDLKFPTACEANNCGKTQNDGSKQWQKNFHRMTVSCFRVFYFFGRQCDLGALITLVFERKTPLL